jgi:hypothetical protein
VGVGEKGMSGVDLVVVVVAGVGVMIVVLLTMPFFA